MNVMANTCSYATKVAGEEGTTNLENKDIFP
jgi:hypothetical protein